MLTRNALTTALILSAAFLLTACEKPAPSPTASTAPGSTPAAGLAWVLTSMPEGAVPVGQLKADAKEGDRVVMRGRIGGRSEPMTSGSAVFVVMDLSIPSCAEVPDDKCPTPWDYCCEPRESLAANNATVMVVNPAGQAVDTDMRLAGFAPLDEVVVVGVVGPRPSPEVLTVRAEGVYRVGG
jgi:hypothetical protein